MNKTTLIASVLLMVTTIATIQSCKKDATTTSPRGKDITTAPKVSVDRFSTAAGHLMVRSASNGLPAANAAINFDVAPFITHGLDRTGAHTMYYNFDVHPNTPDAIYVFFKAGATSPIAGQNNVINSLPGDPTYNDFWQVNKVTVPDSYVPNTLTNETAILASGYPISVTNMIVNCPVVPFGTTAAKSGTAGTASALTNGWYKDSAVAYFEFNEASITASNNLVPTSPIYVMFANNASPAVGFKVEPGTAQTHNVLATIPTDASYSPLWNVNVIDTSHFSSISSLASAQSFTSTPAGALVNCPSIK